MKKVYFVRHGETHANASRTMSGGEHDTDLNENGIKQIQRTGAELKDKNIQLIICSTQRRAHKTAEIIAEQIGYNPNKIIENDNFVEQYMGPYSGQSYDVYNKDKDLNRLLPGIETSEELHSRVMAGLDFLRGLKEQRIVIVAHGGTGRMVKAVIQELPHSHYRQVERIGNGEIYEFELE